MMFSISIFGSQVEQKVGSFISTEFLPTCANMEKTKVLPLPFHSLNAAGSLDPRNIGFAALTLTDTAVFLRSSVSEPNHIWWGRRSRRFFIFIFCSALHVCFFLPGSTVTHPRLCRAHSCPGSVMSLGFSVGSTVCPVCIGGKRGSEDTAFSVREKDKNKPP